MNEGILHHLHHLHLKYLHAERAGGIYGMQSIQQQPASVNAQTFKLMTSVQLASPLLQHAPPLPSPHLPGPVSSLFTSTPPNATWAVADAFVNSPLSIRLWWLSVAANFPFVVFLREKQLNRSSTASVMAQRRRVQSNKGSINFRAIYKSGRKTD